MVSGRMGVGGVGGTYSLVACQLLGGLLFQGLERRRVAICRGWRRLVVAWRVDVLCIFRVYTT